MGHRGGKNKKGKGAEKIKEKRKSKREIGNEREREKEWERAREKEEKKDSLCVARLSLIRVEKTKLFNSDDFSVPIFKDEISNPQPIRHTI